MNNNLDKITKKILMPLIGIPKIRPSGYWFKCPFCKNYRKPHKKLVVDVEHGGRFHCWVCNAKGGKFYHLLKKLNAPKKYFEMLEETSGVEIDYVKENQKFVELPVGCKKILDFKDGLSKKMALNYLYKRGISDLEIMRYNMMITEEDESYSSRVIIPSYDNSFNLNYFVTRDITGFSEIKYKNPSASKNIVFFEYLINWDQPIFIVEGVFDAMAIGDNAIPILGKFVLNNLKSKIIKNRTPIVYIALDPDAYEKMTTIAESLKNSYNKVYIVKIPEGEDCGSLGDKVWDYIYDAEEFDRSKMMLNIMIDKGSKEWNKKS